MKKINIVSLAIVLAFTFITFSVVSAGLTGGWTPPPSTAPLPNADAPINVSSLKQVKNGSLGLGGSLFVGGDVGVGIADPKYKLDIVGNLRVDSSAESQFKNGPTYTYLNVVNTGTDQYGRIGVWYEADNTPRPLVLQQTGGSLGVGTTAAPQSGYRMDINGKAIADDFCIRLAGGGIKCLSELVGGTGTTGVTKIVAGNNVTIDPPGGTGVVTINAITGGAVTPKPPEPPTPGSTTVTAQGNSVYGDGQSTVTAACGGSYPYFSTLASSNTCQGFQVLTNQKSGEGWTVTCNVSGKDQICQNSDTVSWWSKLTRSGADWDACMTFVPTLSVVCHN